MGASSPSRVAAALAAGVVAVAALAGCGSSGSKPAAVAPNPEGVSTGGRPLEHARRGGQLTILTSGDVDSIDPGRAYYWFSYEVLYPMDRPLYSFRPDDDGSVLRPDLAAGAPEIGDGGRTITVHIRPGIRYSPPYGKEVRAADVRYAIERALRPKVLNGYVSTYLGGLAGLDAFKSGRAKHISGITTPDAHTIVFRTTGRGWGDVLGALALPVTSPVPEAYARRYDHGSGQSTYGAHQLATGPYMLRRYRPGHLIEIVRNPNWNPRTDFRPAYLDRVTFMEGNSDPGVATRQIVTGRSMASGDFAPPPDLAREIARGPHRRTLTIAPGAGVRFVGINTTIKPFDDVDVRRAIAASLDRRRMLAVRGGRFAGDVATHFIYPTTEGFRESGGYAGPRLDFLRAPGGSTAVARRYMRRAGYPSGRYTGRARILMVGESGPSGSADAGMVAAALRRLGFRVQLRLVDQQTMYTRYCQVPRVRVAICPNLGWIRDYSDPGTLLAPLFDPATIAPTGNIAFSQFRGAGLGADIARAISLPRGAARVRAWARIDEKVTGLALGVPYAWDRMAAVASPDVRAVNQLWNQGAIDYSFSALE